MQLGISGKNQFTDTQKEIADYNNDGKIDVQDVTKAQMIISEVTVRLNRIPRPILIPNPILSLNLQQAITENLLTGLLNL